jgi:hypothetical protein
MKRFSFFLALALVVASFGFASAGQVSLDNTTNEWTAGKISPGVPVVFSIRVTNDNAAAAGGITNGFSICADGPFTPPVGTIVEPNFSTFFDLVQAINTFSIDGSGCDTIGFGGSKLTGSGLPVGYDDVMYEIATGGVDSGFTLCLDSSFYPPTGSWLWAPGGAPSWDGPHCFLSFPPDCQPPTFDNAPVALAGSHCDVMQFDFDATDNPTNIPPTGPVVYSASIGTIDPNTGAWSYNPTLADVGASVSVTVTADNGTCATDAVVDLTFTNEAPVPTCPATQSVSVNSASQATVTATDDCDPFTFAIVGANPLGATIDPNTGVVSFTATSAGTFPIEVEVTDGNASATCSFDVTAVEGSLYQVEIGCIGEPEGPVFQGQHIQIPVNLATGNIIDGYDLLIGYDNSALSFQFADPGADLVADGWEYFTYRYGANGNCSNACPTGLIRLTAIAETNNGPNHPVLDGVNELAVIDFLVTNDRTLECQNIALRFYWMDCGDNTLSSDGGNALHVSEHVFDGDASLNPPNGLDIYDPTVGFPTYQGTQDECIVAGTGKPVPVRDASFKNGCVFIACADAIDARGDINLNYVSNEIADAVLFSNYFVYGIGVFTINMEGQIAASDVNADGLALSVADLVYLIRVIVGDALPYPKAVASVSTNAVIGNGTITVDEVMGAALVVLEGNATFEAPENMTVKSNFDGTNTRVLIYSMNHETFSGQVISSNSNIISYELATADGGVLNVAKEIPANFELAQNYPNPFNPSTAVSFSLPSASDVVLSVYNVTGQKVQEISGSYEAGFHTLTLDFSDKASGIYFYKLNAGNFAETKKMVLLK